MNLLDRRAPDSVYFFPTRVRINPKDLSRFSKVDRRRLIRLVTASDLFEATGFPEKGDPLSAPDTGVCNRPAP